MTNSDLGTRLHDLVARLYPLPRSITGDGVRSTLSILAEHLPLTVQEIPSGTPVHDWHIPREWRVREAWIEGPDGSRVVDWKDNNLCLVGYSAPYEGVISLEALRPHLHSLPDRPEWIPYRTSYWNEDWGFCLQHARLETLEKGDYRVKVDAELFDGSLTLGELVIPGETQETVLVSTHTCHPSLANDNCTGIAVAAELARHLMGSARRRYSYVFVFAPATIGAIAWLATHQDTIHRIRHGIVLAGVGSDNTLTWKRSCQGDTVIDRVAEYVLKSSSSVADILDFDPYGYDERQYCSPGYDLPVGRFSRGVHGTYPEYHTSADNLDFVSPEALAESFETVVAIIDVLERNRRYRNLAPHGEPQLGRRGLYAALGARPHPGDLQMSMLWVLNQSDGNRDLMDIANRSGIPFGDLADAAELLRKHDLLEYIDEAKSKDE